MSERFGIIFIVWTELIGCVATCGTLEFEATTVAKGGTAKLVYQSININAGRTWWKEIPRASPIELLSSKVTTKYSEQQQGTKFTLFIYDVQWSDAGSYVVRCGVSTHTSRAKLNVSAQTIDDETPCGNLQVERKNFTEKEKAMMIFSTRPGREIVWEKQINSSFRQVNITGRYSISKNQGNTLHNLLIFQTEYADSGTYRVKCGHAVSNTVQLHIVPTPPTSPEFLGVEDIDECEMCIPTSLNVTEKVKCSVSGGSQPIELTMFKDGHKIDQNLNRFTDDRDNISKTFILYSFKPSTADFDTLFKCTVKNPALKAEVAQTAKLYIKVEPETIDIKIRSATENEQSEIQCTTTQGRPPMKSSIYFGPNEEHNVQITDKTKTGQTYSVTTSLFKAFTRLDNQKEVLCCSNILTRKCSTRANVNVKFPPRSVSVAAEKKENKENGDTVLILKCSVDESNPKSSVGWNGVKDLPKKLLDEEYKNHTQTHGWTFSTIMRFNLTKKDNYRTIRCRVTNPEFPNLELQKSYRPNITYAPIITISGSENRTAYIGEDVFLTCQVDSNPPSVIQWQNETGQIGESYGTNRLDVHLANISLDHSQTYTCTAYNNIGGAKIRKMTLIVKDASEKPSHQSSGASDSSSVAGPVVGGAVVIIVAIAAVTVFLILRKRRQNAAPQRKGTYQLKVEERKQSVHPVGNEPIYNNMQAAGDDNEAEEQPEYASVVPKAERENKTEHKNPDDENTEHNNPNDETPMFEKGDTLVYADLDLNPLSENGARKSITAAQSEPTEYVSIDFTKTGTVKIDEDGEI